MDILRIAEELQSLIDTGTRVPGFRRKVLVDIDRLVALGEEFSTSVPASIHEAQEILKQKQSIINQSYLEAQRIKSAAEQEATALKTTAQQEHESKVEESEIVKSSEAKAQDVRDEAMTEGQQIVQDAQRQAYRITNDAEAISKDRRDGADQYARRDPLQYGGATSRVGGPGAEGNRRHEARRGGSRERGEGRSGNSGS